MYRLNLGGMKNGNRSGGKHFLFFFLLFDFAQKTCVLKPC
jgi:hypothetical protein